MKRITMQDIADACGLSRNTVSKIFNNRGEVPDATRKLVLEKARQLFGAYFITSFTGNISRDGYTMQMYNVSPEEIAEKSLPPHLDLEQNAGILGIELFDRDYIDAICSLNKPTLFVDGYARTNKALIGCDFVSMENISSEIALVNRMITGGAKRLGFVGDFMHCNSFYERWVGFCTALSDAGLPVDKTLCILDDDSELYGDTEWLFERLSEIPELPDAFACANDYLALHLMTALKKMGLSIPEDIMITGFDGSPESAIVEPSLTTAAIPSADIGKLSASLLAERIRNPEFPFHWTYVKTSPVWGRSTP